MGCSGSSNNRTKVIKKQTQYKGMFRDRVVEDVDKRKRIIKKYMERVESIEKELNALEANKDPNTQKTREELQETQKTLIDKIEIQEDIVHKIIVRLRIVESPQPETPKLEQAKEVQSTSHGDKRRDMLLENSHKFIKNPSLGSPRSKLDPLEIDSAPIEVEQRPRIIETRTAANQMEMARV
ncbi:unnamed protein product [Moneuplotes crassus]|uniref:Uncharacterized protein n=1 Tax=Euplotes crassus TaxID=5936 RepID=A0AAD1X626_EUPCR|nr:unnamed protein product [Moneuplotes crassus]